MIGSFPVLVAIDRTVSRVPNVVANDQVRG